MEPLPSWMRRVCSHSRQCGLAAKVSGRQGRTAQPDSNKAYGLLPSSPNQSSRGSGNGLARFLCFGAPSWT